MATKAQAFAADIEGFRVEGLASHREVTAVVDAGGRLVDLRLKESISDLTARDVAAAVLDAYRSATARAAADLSRKAAETFGEGSGTAEALTQDFNRHLGRS